jgi:thiol:disulfide interchange protein
MFETIGISFLFIVFGISVFGIWELAKSFTLKETINPYEYRTDENGNEIVIDVNDNQKKM